MAIYEPPGNRHVVWQIEHILDGETGSEPSRQRRCILDAQAETDQLIAAVVGVPGLTFIVYCASRPDEGCLSWSVTMVVPPEKIFPYIDNLAEMNRSNPFVSDPQVNLAISHQTFSVATMSLSGQKTGRPIGWPMFESPQ